MSTKASQERSLKSLRTRHLRGVKAAKLRSAEMKTNDQFDLYPLPYISINADGSEKEIYVSLERRK